MRRSFSVECSSWWSFIHFLSNLIISLYPTRSLVYPLLMLFVPISMPKAADIKDRRGTPLCTQSALHSKVQGKVKCSYAFTFRISIPDLDSRFDNSRMTRKRLCVISARSCTTGTIWYCSMRFGQLMRALKVFFLTEVFLNQDDFVLTYLRAPNAKIIKYIAPYVRLKLQFR